jgi:fibronectin-binding autotransporter adhesin
MRTFHRHDLLRSAAIARILVLGSAALAASPAFAQDSWTGATSNNWFTGTNWADGTAPTAADNVVINISDASAPVIAAGAAVSGTVDVAAAGTGQLIIAQGATLTSSGGPQSRLGVNAGASGTAIVTDNGSRWNLSHALIVGREGTGELSVQFGGQVASTVGVVGDLAGSSGSALVFGANSRWDNTGNLFVGNFGTGAMTVGSGGAVTSGVGGIGGGADAVGTVTVEGANSSWTVTNALNVGNFGEGTLTIEDGGTVSSDTMTLGLSAGGEGRVTVDGTNAELTMTDILVVGDAGDGTLTVTGGGTVTSARGAIASDIGGTGSVEVAGAGSLWDAGDVLSVGALDSGRLEITDGGTVNTDRVIIGGAEPGVGSVIVDGAGSTLTVGGDLLVSSNGAGAMVISGGGSVTSTTGGLGLFTPGTDGDVLITGSGSRWDITDALRVGIGGTGTVTVADGGVLSAGDGITLALPYPVTTTGILNIGAAAGAPAVAPGTVSTPTIELGEGDGTIVFNHTAANYLFAPAITGLGTVNVLAGRTILTGANSYTGITNIADGATLQVGNGGATGNIVSDVALDGGTLAFARAGELAYGGVISGTGAVTQTGGTLVLSGANSFSGDITVNIGTLGISTSDALGADANTLVLLGGTLQARAAFSMVQNIRVGSTSSNRIDTNGFDVTISGVIADGAGTSSGNFVDKLGAGTLTLTGANTYSNRTVLATGTLALAGNGTIGAGNLIIGAGTVFDISQANVGARVIQLNGPAGGTIALGSKTLTLGFGASFTDWAGTITDGGIAGGTGGRVVILAPGGAVRFFDGHSYTDGTTVAAGTFELVGNGALFDAGAVTVGGGALFQISGLAGPGTVIGDLAGAGSVNLGAKALTVGTANDTLFSGAITGLSGALTKQGTGTLTLTGVNVYNGATTVAAGTLRVNGILSLSAVTANAGATLGGTGVISGDVTIADGGRLAPGASAGTLTVGSLALSNASQLDFELGQAGVVGGGVNDFVVVASDLVLDGVLNVTDIGGFGPGIYRLFDYSGALTDNGLDFGALPAGSNTDDFFVQTRIARQVNLVSSFGATLGFWDGGDPALHDDGIIQGGDGVWDAANRNWTVEDGAVNGLWNQDFAIFGGAAGTVTVDTAAGAVSFSGMQFMTDGYAVAGDALTTTTAKTIIRADAGVTATIASAITGSGGLVKTDAGTLVLEGINSYAGGTTVRGGTLSVWRDANLGAATGGLTLDGGTLQSTIGFTTARNVTLGAGGGTIDAQGGLAITGVISGAGGLTVSSRPFTALFLTGNNTYTGGTTVRNGSLQLGEGGTSGAIVGNVLLDDGTLFIDRSDTYTFAGTISGDGAFVQDGTGTTILTGTNTYTNGTRVTDGTLQIGAGGTSGSITGNALVGGTLAFNRADAVTFSGVVSGSGSLEQIGSGALILSGDSAAFAGATTVRSGRLVVNGSLGGALSVLAGARLEGIGTIGSTTIANGGTIAPGNSIGTLTVNGDITFAPGSIYEVEVDPAGTTSDLIAASGRAILDGGSVLHIGLDGDYRPQATYTIVTAAGGVQGEFDDITSSFAFLDPTLGYTANTVTLVLERNDIGFCEVALTANQCAAGTGAEELGFGNPVFDAILLLDDPGARAAFDLLSGEIYASLHSVLVQDSRMPRAAALDRMRQAGAAADPEPGLRLWMQGLGSWGHIDGDGNARRVKHDSAGFLIGLDAIANEELQLGVFGGYQRGNADVRAAASEADIDSYHVGLYAGADRGRLGLRAGYAFSWHQADVTRRIAFGDFADSTTADFDASTAQAFGEIAYRLDLGPTRIEPFAQIAHVFVDSERLRERGGAAALDVARERTTVRFSTLGARTEQTFSLGAMEASLRVAAGWRHAFGDRLPVVASSFAGSSPFLIAGTPVARDALSADIGVSVALSSRARLDLSYIGDVASDAEIHYGRATLSWAF